MSSDNVFLLYSNVMKPAQIKEIIFDKLNIKSVYAWFFVRFLNTFFPLAITWIFAQGVAALETGKSLRYVIQIYLIWVVAHVLDNLLRIGSRARIRILMESAFIELQEHLVYQTNHSKNRVEIIQAIRNLTDALRVFIDYVINSGLPGVVKFISVPIILYLIDKKIFIAEVVLIFIYLILVYVLSKIYERKFENLDTAHESYYAAILERKNPKIIAQRGEGVKKGVKGVESIIFYQWISFQDLIALFQFIVIGMIAIDFINGTKQISDLVLIVGYTNESQGFLNSVTSGVDSIMQIEAGIDRLVETTNSGKTTSTIS